MELQYLKKKKTDMEENKTMWKLDSMSLLWNNNI